MGASEGQGDGVTERTSYLTGEEVQAAQVLHTTAPFALTNVSRGFFSISRHYGGLTYLGCHYVYIDGHDECVRDDVLRLVKKLRKLKAKAAKPEAMQMQLEIGETPS